MRTNDKIIIKHIIPVTTALGCYADDLWIIPLQNNTSQTPDIYDNGFVDNHGQPYIEIFHADDELPEKNDEKNKWRVKIQRLNEDNEYEIYAHGAFRSAREAVNSQIVEHALAKRRAQMLMNQEVL